MSPIQRNESPEQEQATHLVVLLKALLLTGAEGIFMAATAEVLEPSLFDPEQRFYYDTTTLMAEVLGPMRTSFEYTFDGQEIYAHDGSALAPVFDGSIVEAERIKRRSPNLAFELRRRKLEKGEYTLMLAMARGEAPNTLIVVSDFPPELLEAEEDIGGYNVTRKQAMLRVIALQPTGKLRVTSQSLDGSYRPGLEAMYHTLGTQPMAGELLGQHISLNLTADEQDALTDQLTGVYDRVLEAHTGIPHLAGQPHANHTNAYEFVCKQQDLLQVFTEQVKTKGSLSREDLTYNLAAALKRRYESASLGSIVMHTVAMSPQAEMFYAGGKARLEKQTFSGCGLSLRGEEHNVTSDLETLGYGNRTNGSEKYKFDKKMHCVVCQAPPKKNEKKKMCGPCGICESCDAKFKKEE